MAMVNGCVGFKVPISPSLPGTGIKRLNDVFLTMSIQMHSDDGTDFVSGEFIGRLPVICAVRG
jgi:hypothetical protein